MSYRTIMLTVYILLTLATSKLGAVQIIQGPVDVSVREGETARFPCIYNGTRSIPFWRINHTVYSPDMLPHRHIYSYPEQTLIVNDVILSLNSTIYQCEFFSAISSKGVLAVFSVNEIIITEAEMERITLSLTTNEAVTTELENTQFHSSSIFTNITADLEEEDCGSTMGSCSNGFNSTISAVHRLTLVISISVVSAACVIILLAVLILFAYMTWKSSHTKAQNGIALEENPCYEQVNVKVEENPCYIPSRIEMEANLCYGDRRGGIQLKKNENTENIPGNNNDQIIYETII